MTVFARVMLFLLSVFILVASPVYGAEEVPQLFPGSRNPMKKWEVEEIADGIYGFRYTFYRDIFIVTDDGVIVTDPLNKEAANILREEIRKITDQPVKYVAYTHSHWDHVSGGQVFKDEGAEFIAQEECAEHFLEAPNPDVVYPDVTYRDRYRITLGGKSLAEVAERFDQKGRTLPPELDRVGIETGIVGDGEPHPLQALRGGGDQLRAARALVRRACAGHEEHLLEAERVADFFGRAQVPQVDRVEGSPVDPDTRSVGSTHSRSWPSPLHPTFVEHLLAVRVRRERGGDCEAAEFGGGGGVGVYAAIRHQLRRLRSTRTSMASPDPRLGAGLTRPPRP